MPSLHSLRSATPKSSPHRVRRAGLRTAAVGVAIAVVSVAVPATTGQATSLSYDLKKLRHCESGGRWHVNTGNGYYGAYQFADRTWHGLGFHGRPDLAKPATQSAAAMKLHSRQGWRPWPSCARKEHL